MKVGVNVILLSIGILIIGFGLLVKGADTFVDGCVKLAKSFGIPTLIIGLTVVSFGTSAPELAVSSIAAFHGNSSIALGNVVGSNVCNLLVVLGVSSLFGALYCERKVVSRDFLYSIFATIILIIMTVGFFINGYNEGVIGRTYGFLLLCFLIIYVYALVLDALNSSKTEKMEEDEKEEKTKLKFKDILFIIIGLASIILGGELVVKAATEIAKALGISEGVIALTVVAIGTSLPELVTSVMAVRKGEHDIAIGNAIGSNIFNILLILGVASVIKPITFDFNSMIDIFVMLGAELLVFVFTLKNMRIGNKKGIIMILAYIAYTGYLLMR